MSKIKIFSTQRIDKECTFVSNEIFMPIRCGAIFDKNESSIQGDNIGENISTKRMSYCELTTQYWVWKNVESDYYGFCHYRRYFSFSPKRLDVDNWNSVIRDYLNEKTIKELNMDNPRYIKDVVERYDVILPEAIDLKRLGILSVYDQYKTGQQLHIEDLDITLDIIKDLYPDYYRTAQEYLAGTTIHLCNMFIMKSDLFNQYSQWLFDILFEFERRADMSLYSEEGYRTPGHLGERLLGIFCLHLQKQNKYKFGNLQMVVFSDPSPISKINPVFDGEAVSIVLSSTEYYAPFCAATIKSIINNSSPDINYDIIVLEKEICTKTKNLFQRLTSRYANISIRFLNVRQKMSEYQLHIREHFAIETFFRLGIPELLPLYRKVLYLDCDLIVNDDVALLYNINISDYSIAGVPDTVLAGHINGFSKNKHLPYYTGKVHIKQENLMRQVNAGVLLMNLDRIREQYTSTEMLNYAQIGQFELCDQDVMNALFQDEIMHIPFEWNAMDDEESTLRAYVATFAPREMYNKYKNAMKTPKIIHYAGTIKPWNDPSYERAIDFWDVLRETPFYEIVIHRRIVENAQHFANVHINNKSSSITVYSNSKRTLFRRTADFFFPLGSKRREDFKKALCKISGKTYVAPPFSIK